MAIVKMSNFSLFAFDSEREDLLHELQKFRYVHFVHQEEDEEINVEGLKSVEVPESIVAIDEEISKISYSIDLLSKYTTKEKGIKAMQQGQKNFDFKELEEKADSIDYTPLYNELRHIWNEKENLNQEIIKLKAENEELRPWIKLNSPIKSLDHFEQSQMFLGTIPKAFKAKINEDLLEAKLTYFEVISEDRDNLYVLSLTSKSEEEMVREILRNNSFSNIKLFGEKTPEEEISERSNRIVELEKGIEEFELKIGNLSNNLSEIEIVYDYLLNKKLRIVSSQNFLMTEKVNMIKGFIPTERVEEFTEAIKSALNNVYFLQVSEAEKEDPKVPILLENSKFTESFEALTGMYSLPKYNEIDPTPFLAPFYLAFFGMMAADFGYGVIMLIATFVVLKTFNLSDTSRKFIRFFYYLSFSVMIWGLIYGSILGGIIPMKGLINPAEDYMTLLIISIIFGVIHVFFALALKAYVLIRDGKYLDTLYDVVFWYLALIGGIVYLLNIIIPLPPVLKTIALIVMVVGMAGIVLFGGRESKTVVGKLGGGIYSLYGITGYVGDFVSYSRLMALGLAGGFIAGAVNMMSGMLVEKGILGIVGAVVVFIIGQAFNLGLSLLGAYVHTIRLTFVEFFGKFYEGGGKRFNLFRSEAKYINLK